jgi:hypothetical protein
MFKSIKIPIIPMDPDIRENNSSMIDVTESGRSGRLIQPKTILIRPDIRLKTDSSINSPTPPQVSDA